jgi:hypothetical protein
MDLNGETVQLHIPVALPPVEKPDARRTRGRVDPTAVLLRYGEENSS